MVGGSDFDEERSLATAAPAVRPAPAQARYSPGRSCTSRRPVRTRCIATSSSARSSPGLTQLTLIGAPAGSGKTSLLSAWHADPREHRPFAWISLDSADNDPVRFWDGVIAALRTIDPTIGADAQTALHSPGTTVGDHVLPLLINELATLATSRSCSCSTTTTSIESGADPRRGRDADRAAARRTVHLVISTRSDPPLPLGRLRARAPAHRDPRRRSAIQRRTRPRRSSTTSSGSTSRRTTSRGCRSGPRDGSPGLQLAGPVAAGPRGPSGVHRVLRRRRPPDRRLPRLRGARPPTPDRARLPAADLDPRPALGASVRRRDRDGATPRSSLAELEHANLFVVALDSKREWYRYHHLFADLLRHELAQAHPDAGPELHRRAAAWYRDEGAIHEAIEHATAAGDFANAIELITTHWYEFLQRGRVETVAGWIDGCPPETVTNDPTCASRRRGWAINMGRLDEVDRWVGAAERAAPSGRTPGAAAAGIGRRQPPRHSPLHGRERRRRGRRRDGTRSTSSAAAPHRRGARSVARCSAWRCTGAARPTTRWQRSQRGGRDRKGRRQPPRRDARLGRAGRDRLRARRRRGRASPTPRRRPRSPRSTSLGEHWAGSLSLAVRGQVLDRQGPSWTRPTRRSAAPSSSPSAVSPRLRSPTRSWPSPKSGTSGAMHDEARAATSARRGARSRSAPIQGSSAELTDARSSAALPVAPQAAPTAGTEPEALSEAELAVLRLLRSDLSQREIGAELFISLQHGQDARAQHLPQARRGDPRGGRQRATAARAAAALRARSWAPAQPDDR